MNRLTTFRWPVLFATGLSALIAAAVFAPRRGAPVHPQQQVVLLPQGGAKAIDMVIAIDTSSSMDGLIDSARQQLWESVGRLGRAEPQRTLRVGLISYGNTSYEAKSGWVRVESDLTTDLDSVYARLFALRTGGGEEYVARALSVATNGMSWSQDDRTRRLFIVAGNEPADQDPQVSLQEAQQGARARHISVNTIYCGSESNVESNLWRKLAQEGEGKFAAIDQDAAVVVATPVDQELARLSQALNQTYVAYGVKGEQRAQNQVAQDGNAGSLGAPAAASRAIAKSSAAYRNGDWDLVDAAKEGKLAEVKEADLPEPMRKLSLEERKAFIEKQAKERASLQARIDELSKERAVHIQRAKAQSPSKGRDFDRAMGDIE